MNYLTLRARVSLFFVVALIVAGCGGGGGTGPVDTINPTVRDQLAADAAVTQVSDLSGYFIHASTRSSSSSDASESVSGAAAECFPTNDAKTASAVREFVNGPQLRHIIVRGEVETHADASTLTGKLTAFTPATAAECMKQFIARLFASEGGVVGEVAVTPSKVDASFDEQVGFVFTVPVSSGGAFTIGVEIVLGRVDRFRSTVSVVAFDHTPDHSLAVAAMAAMANRLP
jgi:hypothetical protein